MELQAPGLFVAGHARDGISLGDSIVSAHNVAARIQAFLASEVKRPKAMDHPVSV
jgi:heterodisulfide reductase subunit A-like polyferredoxin